LVNLKSTIFIERTSRSIETHKPAPTRSKTPDACRQEDFANIYTSYDNRDSINKNENKYHKHTLKRIRATMKKGERKKRDGRGGPHACSNHIGHTNDEQRRKRRKKKRCQRQSKQA
jgi:hypothetical protein